jgi:integrase
MKLKSSNIGTIELLPGKTERIVFDDDLPGFGLRVRDGGSRVYVTQYKLGAKQRRITLGSTKELTLVQARFRAKDVLAKVHLGEDPASAKSEARARATDTFKAAADRYLLYKEKKLRPASYYTTRLYLMKHLRLLHELRIDKIDRREIASRLSAIAQNHGAVTADRARSALSAFFAWAIAEGLADSNPVIGTTKYAEPPSRDRVLTEDELAAVWSALPDNDYGHVLKLLVLTACRADEIAWLRWSEIDLGERKISFPAERTKNKRPHLVPLSATAIDIIKNIPRRADRDLVFGRGDGGFQGWSKCKAELDAKLNIPDWVIHDIRRTVATRMAEAPVSIQPHIIEAVLNHVSGHKGGIAGIYNKATYWTEKRYALDRWEHHLAVILAQASGANVLSMRGR